MLSDRKAIRAFYKGILYMSSAIPSEAIIEYDLVLAMPL
jgi:hypothetical protein